MLKKRNIGRDVTDFHGNTPTPHILPSLTVTKSVYPPPPPLRDVINGWPRGILKKHNSYKLPRKNKKTICMNNVLYNYYVNSNN